MTRLDMQTRVKSLRTELEDRYKYGTVKIASEDGKPVPTVDLQNELYNLIYRLSKFD